MGARGPCIDGTDDELVLTWGNVTSLDPLTATLSGDTETRQIAVNSGLDAETGDRIIVMKLPENQLMLVSGVSTKTIDELPALSTADVFLPEAPDPPNTVFRDGFQMYAVPLEVVAHNDATFAVELAQVESRASRVGSSYIVGHNRPSGAWFPIDLSLIHI